MADSPIHVFVAHSRRVECRKGRLQVHRAPKRWHYDGEFMEAPILTENLVTHVLAVDFAGWGWDGRLLSRGDAVSLKDLMERWVQDSPVLFGRQIQHSDFAVAYHDRCPFDDEIRQAFTPGKVPWDIAPSAEWGRVQEWEHVFSSLTKLSPAFGDFKQAQSAMSMVGRLWARVAPAAWESAKVPAPSAWGSREPMKAFVDAALAGIVHVFEAMGGAAMPILPQEPAMVTWPHARFRARKRLPASIIGSLSLSGLSIERNEVAPAESDWINVPGLDWSLGGGPHLAASPWTICFRINDRAVRVPVYRSYEYTPEWVFAGEKHSAHYSERGFFVPDASFKGVAPCLVGPNPALAALGYTSTVDFLDRLCASALVPLGVLPELERVDALILASLDAQICGFHGGCRLSSPALVSAKVYVDTVKTAKRVAEIMVTFCYIEAKEGQGHSIPSGCVHLPVRQDGTVDLSGVFTGFDRPHSLADEFMERIPRLAGSWVKDWLPPGLVNDLQVRARAIASGCQVSQLTKTKKPRAEQDGVRFDRDGDRAAKCFN